MVASNKGRKYYFQKTQEAFEQMGQVLTFPEISFFLNVCRGTPNMDALMT